MKDALLHSLLLLAVSVLLAPSIVAAETAALSRQDFLKQLRENHPLFDAEDYREEIARLTQEGLLGTKDWLLKAETGYYYSEPNDAFFDRPERAYGYSLSSSAQRRLWQTGGTVQFGVQHFQQNQSPDSFSVPVQGQLLDIPRGPSRVYESGVGVQFRQPLRKNLGGLLDRLEYELAAYDIEIEKLEAEEVKENFLFATAQRFVEWEYLSEIVRIAQQRFTLSKQQHHRTLAQYNENLIDKVDVARSKNDRLFAKQRLTDLQSQWNAKRSELAQLLQVPTAELLQPHVDLYHYSPNQSFEQLWSELQSRSRRLELLRTAQQQLALQQQGAEEQQKKQIDLVSSLAVRGDDSAPGGSLALERPEAYLGVEFTHALGSTAARTQQKALGMSLKKIASEYKSMLLQLRAQLSSITTRLSDLKKIIALNKQQIEQAKQKTTEEVARYKRGQSDFSFVLQSQDEEQRAQELLIANSATYQNLQLQLTNLLDTLL